MPDLAAGENMRFLLKEETHRIIGCAFEVLNEIGHGFYEKIYENALVVRTQMDTDGYRFLTRLKPRSPGENERELMDAFSLIAGLQLHCPYLCSSVSICGFPF